MKSALSLLLHLGSLCRLPVALYDAPVPPVVPTVRLSIAVAETADGPVQTPGWVYSQVIEAQRVYNAFGIYFTHAETRPLDSSFANLETRKDRDNLAGVLKKGVLNVFIVESLRDVDDPRLYRGGVHWAPNGDLTRQYVIVAAGAGRTTLAHEIGHYFKLQHAFVTDNLMSYDRTGGVVFLNAKQKATVVTSAKAYTRAKELVP